MPPSATSPGPDAASLPPGQAAADGTLRHTALFKLSAAVLFAIAVLGVTLALPSLGLASLHPLLALAFVGFGLFTILCGFPHPYYGHVSFDRVAQYATLLIFGPVAAALISGLACLLHPWQRLRQGESVPRIVATSLANAGMMMIVILISGGVYLWLDGRLPLYELQQRDIVPLVAMAVTAHVLNELILAWLLWTQGGDIRKLPSRFEYSVEFVCFAAAVLLAISYNSLDSGSFVLTLLLMAGAMLVLHHFALLRISLEQQVAERTRELEIRTEELDQQAKHDVLTGLYNRRYVDQRLLEQISIARLHDKPLCLALADLDHFKQVNDQYSHAIGDKTLQKVARILHANLRDSDIVARFGGEEFLICLPNTRKFQARIICERIRCAVQGHGWTQLAPGMQMSLSIGLASLEENEDLDLNDLVELADQRLYAAKRGGRNLVVSE